MNSLTPSPYCGGLLRQNPSVSSPALSATVTGFESCHVPTVKGSLMTILKLASFTASGVQFVPGVRIRFRISSVSGSARRR